MDFTGKRLLILGGAAQSTKIVTAAKEMGIHTIVMDINENAPAKREADESVSISLQDFDGMLQWVAAHPVDGIINICIDYAQKALQVLCDATGLPSFGNEYQVRALTDKALFKQLCKENGIDTIPEYAEEDVRSGNAEFPLFVKPAECSGSRATTTCKTFEEFEVAVAEAKKESRNGKAIIEKYLGDCPDFQPAYIFIDGEPYLQRTADRYHGFRSDGMENVSALAVSPSKYTDLFIDSGIHDRIVAMLQKLKIKTAAVFFQGFVEGDKIRFYDPGIRLPGANFENILKPATGIDVVKMFIEYALTGHITSFDPEKLKQSYLLDGQYAAISFPMVGPGVIASIEGDAAIKANKNVISGSFRRFVGERIERTGDVKQRLGEYNILAKTKEELRETIRFVEDTLVVRDTEGRDMFISKPDVSAI